MKKPAGRPGKRTRQQAERTVCCDTMRPLCHHAVVISQGARQRQANSGAREACSELAEGARAELKPVPDQNALAQLSVCPWRASLSEWNALSI